MSRCIRNIIRDCNGRFVISDRSRERDPEDWVKPVSVLDWYHNGIPEKRWPIIMSLTDITEAELHAANEAVRTKKKGSELHQDYAA